MLYSAVSEQKIELTDEFQDALTLLQSPAQSHPLILITGKAGTGKTTLLTLFSRTTVKNTVVLATTGIAAVNVRGQTVHSFFHLKPGNLLDLQALKKLPRKTVNALETIIVDEASMLRADLLDAMDHILRISTGQNIPFGGKQIILFGDLFQLPPVEENPEKGLFDYFRTLYPSPYFFEARVIKETGIEVFELNRIFRQKNDDTFAQLLNKIREGHVTQAELDELLNCRKTEQEPGDCDDAIILSPTNEGASWRNRLRLDALEGEEFVYPATVDENFKKKNIPAEAELRLKRGAKIMMLNNNPAHYWVNGDIGSVYDLGQDFIKVEIKGRIHQVTPYVWEDVKYQFNPLSQKLEPKVQGFFKQYPLKPAWAITIHKSQGLTFNGVYLDIDRGAFATGQTYVALSQCRTLQGIHLKKAITLRDIRCDARVQDFFRHIRHTTKQPAESKAQKT